MINGVINPLSENMLDSKNKKKRIIRVAILAEEPLGWGSGKHFFPIILRNYTWKVQDVTYKIEVEYIYDKQIMSGKLNTSNYEVFLVPGGGVGDGESILKGLNFLPGVKKWKKNIAKFIKNGGGYVGICGGASLITDLKTDEKHTKTFLERLYDNSSIGVSCVSSYYKYFAFPIFNLIQKKYPEKIGASAYVFSFAPGETKDGEKIYSGGVPVDFQINKDNPIFSDFKSNIIRLRWWGGPALILPNNADRKVKILANYPSEDLSGNKSNRINAWIYTGGFIGIISAFFKSIELIKNKKENLRKLFLYTYFLASDWKLTDKIIDLDYSNKPSITSEIYPNERKGRILLCTSHPEFMVWWDGHIEEVKETYNNCIAEGFHRWKDIKTSSDNLINELTHSWWIVRRFVAWAGKVPDADMPPIEKEKIYDDLNKLISENILSDGELINQIKNI